MYSVYCLETSDGRKYIGVTSLPPHERWNSGNGYRKVTGLWQAITKDGWEKIDKTVLCDNLTSIQASEMEQYYIALYDTTNPTHGYNRELGGIGSKKIISSSSKKRMSFAKMQERNPNYGKPLNDEHKRKIATSNRGQKRSEETCRHIGLAKRKRVCQYTTSGVLIALWDSGKRAARATGTQAGHISKVCKHQRATAGGFIWAYADE